MFLNGIMPEKGERCDTLSGDFVIFQPEDGQRYSTDDFMTAWLAVTEFCAQPPLRFLDLGSGLCSVPMMVLWKFRNLSGIGIELRRNRFLLAQKSLSVNGLTDRFELLHGDLRGLSLDEKFELITSTPPYYTKAEGLLSENCDKAAARFELNGSIENYCEAASEHLAEGGRFITVYPYLYRSRVYEAARLFGMFPRRRVDFLPREGKPPLISIFSIGFGSTDERLERLTMRDPSGNHTEEYNNARILCGFKPKR
ncbi:hypothetical protein J5834_02255 [bacterium]|nr:hypothetical protein [bacterium]